MLSASSNLSETSKEIVIEEKNRPVFLRCPQGCLEG